MQREKLCDFRVGVHGKSAVHKPHVHISGCGSIWQSTCFGSRRLQVQILSSRLDPFEPVQKPMISMVNRNWRQRVSSRRTAYYQTVLRGGESMMTVNWGVVSWVYDFTIVEHPEVATPNHLKCLWLDTVHPFIRTAAGDYRHMHPI